MMIYGYIYITYKMAKIKENRTRRHNQTNSLNPLNPMNTIKPIKLQPSLDQIYDGFKYPSINYKWGGCSNNKPTTKAIKPGSWF
jgi:hypothetical protein